MDFFFAFLTSSGSVKNAYKVPVIKRRPFFNIFYATFSRNFCNFLCDFFLATISRNFRDFLCEDIGFGKIDQKKDEFEKNRKKIRKIEKKNIREIDFFFAFLTSSGSLHNACKVSSKLVKWFWRNTCTGQTTDGHTNVLYY